MQDRELLREGGRHSWWHNPALNKRSAVPRHNEIDDYRVRKRLLCSLGRIAPAVAMLVVLSGCIPIPYASTTELPPVAAHVPNDLRASDRDVMALVQIRSFSTQHVFVVQTGWSFNRSLNEPLYFKAGNLELLGDSLKLSTRSGIVFVSGGAFAVFPLVGTEHEQWVENICLLSSDGRNILLSPSGKDAFNKRQGLLSDRQRDVIISALRTGSEGAFSQVDAPCGMYGVLSWTPEAYSRAIDFLSKVTIQEKHAGSPSLTDAVDAASSNIVILPAALWRNQAFHEPPVYANTTDVDALIHRLAAMEEGQIAASLPSVSSGSRLMSLKHLCLLSADGRITQVVKGGAESTALSESAVNEQWLNYARALVSGNQIVQHGLGNDDCLVVADWSLEEKKSFLSFLDRVRSTDRTLSRERTGKLPAMLTDIMLQRAGTRDTAPRDALLVVVSDRATPANAEPRLLYEVRNFPALVETVISSFGAELSYACVITADGSYIELQQTGNMRWRARRQYPLTATWRRDAIAAIKQHSWSGTFVCGLQHSSNWSNENRNKVVGFLNRISVAEPHNRSNLPQN